MSRRKRNEYEIAYKEYQAGKSLEQIAEELIVSRQCVYQAFKRRDYVMRRDKMHKILMEQLSAKNLREIGFEKFNDGTYVIADESKLILVEAVEKPDQFYSINISHKNGGTTPVVCNTITDLKNLLSFFGINGKEEIASESAADQAENAYQK